MALPKIDIPIYEVDLPCMEKRISFRPFLVKEQKVLLMALESEKEEDIIRSIKQIIRNCVQTENFDVDELSSVDIEYFFMNLRARSIGEKVSLSYKCKNKIEEETCDHLMTFDHDILSAKIIKNPNHSKTIFFSKDVGIVMKYPSLKLTEKIMSTQDTNKIDTALDLIIECIDYIFDKENIYYVKEMNKNEIKDFIENLPKNSFDKMQTFFEDLPQIESIAEHKCEKCGFDHKLTMNGIANFFV